jgi:hypothetical protein
MADAMAAGTAPERVPETEVLVGEIDSTMSDLMLAARQAENLKPLTEEEADAMTVAQLGDRAALIFSHFKFALMSERDFILRFRVELNVLRRKTTQQGRRLPIPGCPTWGEVKKTYFKLSGRQIDALLADPKPDKKEPEPTEVRKITVSDDQPETPTPSDEAVEKIHEAANEPDQPPPVTDAEVARIHEAAADTLPDIEDEVAAEQEPSGWGIVVSRKLAQGLVTPEVVARFLNDTYAEKPGRHEAVRQMLKLLDKCVLMEVAHGSANERQVRLYAKDPGVRHPNASVAAMEMLGLGGFWSAKAILEQGDIHIDNEYDWHEGGVNLERLKGNVLNRLRQDGKLKTRMLGGVYWYTLPDNEAALKAAKKPEGPEFHCAEGELRKGAAAEPPLVEPTAARHGQDADVRVHAAPVEPTDEVVPADCEQFGDARAHADDGAITLGSVNGEHETDIRVELRAAMAAA